MNDDFIALLMVLGFGGLALWIVLRKDDGAVAPSASSSGCGQLVSAGAGAAASYYTKDAKTGVAVAGGAQQSGAGNVICGVLGKIGSVAVAGAGQLGNAAEGAGSIVGLGGDTTALSQWPEAMLIKGCESSKKMRGTGFDGAGDLYCKELERRAAMRRVATTTMSVGFSRERLESLTATNPGDSATVQQRLASGLPGRVNTQT